MEKKEFEYDGKQYEVRSWLQDDNETYKVKVFTDNKPANGYNYSVSLENVQDAKRDKYPQNLLKDLIELAEKDIREKKWEEYLKTTADI
jgi:hypothetical protein